MIVKYAILCIFYVRCLGFSVTMSSCNGRSPAFFSVTYGLSNYVDTFLEVIDVLYYKGNNRACSLLYFVLSPAKEKVAFTNLFRKCQFVSYKPSRVVSILSRNELYWIEELCIRNSN